VHLPALPTTALEGRSRLDRVGRERTGRLHHLGRIGASPAGGYISAVIKPSRLLLDFEARDAREAYRGLTFPVALALYTGLWVEARLLNPEVGGDWHHDLEADFAVARAVNGLPPHT
jgi:hypothetical protein